MPSVALRGEFWDGELKNVLSYMQAAGNKEKERRRTGCGSQAEAQNGKRSFVIRGGAGHKQESQLSGLLIQHTQIKPGTGETCDGCTGSRVHFSCISQPLARPSQPHQADQPFSSPSPSFPLPAPGASPQAGSKSFLLVPVFTKCINCF